MFSRLTPIAEYIPCPLIFQSDYNLSLRRIISLTLPTPMHEMPVVSVRTQQASHGRVSDGYRVKDYKRELLGFKEDNEFTQPVQ